RKAAGFRRAPDFAVLGKLRLRCQQPTPVSTSLANIPTSPEAFESSDGSFSFYSAQPLRFRFSEKGGGSQNNRYCVRKMRKISDLPVGNSFGGRKISF